MRKRRESREKEILRRILAGEEEDAIATRERFDGRDLSARRRRIERTALLRAAEGSAAQDIAALPTGQVVQVYSVFSEVEHEGVSYLCVLRKTVARLSDTPVVAGDYVKFSAAGCSDGGRPAGVIEQVLPRRTVLARADSFKGLEPQPIVANADQMLIVASLLEPEVRWGLVDRMVVAAWSGGLRPIICLNKVELAHSSARGEELMRFAEQALAHYVSLGFAALRTSAVARTGLDELRQILANASTVIAGHSGVGKSSLIRALQPSLDLRVRPVSPVTGKGRHTTTFSRRYDLDFGGKVYDTPGVRLFGLWGVTPEKLINFFPDVAGGTAPPWRVESYQRLLASLEKGPDGSDLND